MKRTIAGSIAGMVWLLVTAGASLACESSSWIVSDPGSGPSGSRVSVSGGGFARGTVLLRWDASAESGGEVIGQAEIGDDGRLLAEVSIPETSPGAHKIVAEHTSASENGPAHAQAWTYFDVPGAPPASEPGSEPAAEEPATAAPEEQPAAPQAGGKASPRAEQAARPTEVVDPSVPAIAHSHASLTIDRSEAGTPRAERAARFDAVRLSVLDRYGSHGLADEAGPSSLAGRPAPAGEGADTPGVPWAVAAALLIASLAVLARRAMSGGDAAPPPDAEVLALDDARDARHEPSQAA